MIGASYMSETPHTRINKYLSEVGYCSRRAADKLIAKGSITINGAVPELGTKVAPGDEVRVNGELVSPSEDKRVYLAFHKPVGIVCTTDTGVEPDNIIDYIGYPVRIFPIGRLDKPSEGLIFLTNDGDIVNKILRARNNHEACPFSIRLRAIAKCAARVKRSFELFLLRGSIGRFAACASTLATA